MKTTAAVGDGRTHVVPREVAERIGVSGEHVLELIRKGVLRASNVAVGVRPRWRVAIADLEAFLADRLNQSVADAGAVFERPVRGGGRRRGRRAAVSASASDEEFV